MRILYVLPRYHTNLSPGINSLIDAGHSVKIIAQVSKLSEDHRFISPEVLGYGVVSEKFCELASSIVPRKSGKLKRYFGVPPIRKFVKKVERFNPDLIIARSGYSYPTLSMIMAKRLNSLILFYDQRPKYGTKDQIFNRQIAGLQITKLVDVIYKRLWDHSPIRITPVRGDVNNPIMDDNAHYIPFVKGINERAYTRKYTPDGKIRILNVGRLHSSRKRHLMLLRSINKLRNQYDISLTIIGSAGKFSSHTNAISEYIYDNEMDDIVNIYWNLDYKKVQQAYINHDLFVLPSSHEPAAVSHLEAMANGLPAICTGANGTSNYIEHGRNGYVIPTDDREALTNRIEEIISDPKKLREMGEASLKVVKDNHHPSIYEKKLMEAVKEARDKHS